VDNQPPATVANGLRFPHENLEWLIGLHFRRLNEDWKALKRKASEED
jgi:hypothetical protein